MTNKKFTFCYDGRTLIDHFCKNCGQKISYNTWRDGLQRCRSCSRKGELHPNWKGGIKTKKYYCINCQSLVTYETWRKGLKRCLSCSRKFRFQDPRNHPNWKGGIDKQPYGWKWTEFLRRIIRKRDNYTCQLCFKKGNTVHHIDYNKKNCEKSNLITLCNGCNSKVNTNRDYWFAYFRYIIEKKDLI